MGVVLLTLVVAALATTASARRDVYYTLRNRDPLRITPRVLIVLDTSNSMAQPAAGSVDGAWDWRGAETAGHPHETRVSIARRAIRTVLQQAAGRADFALMTFARRAAPTQIPKRCDLSAGGDARFFWAQEQRRKIGDGFEWFPIKNHPNADGTWVLCGELLEPERATSKRLISGYPYIRRTELGAGQTVDPLRNVDPSDPVPPSPLIGQSSGDVEDPRNALRRVQWFPRYLGPRANLNSVTDPSERILQATVGDYGTAADVAELRAQVQDYDFYYWPYVDGSPGYGDWVVRNNEGTYANRYATAGLATNEGRFTAELVQPFYLTPEERAAGGIPVADAGPTDAASARAAVADHVAPLSLGGLDPEARAITPWRSTIGRVDATWPSSNQPSSHDTVASYAALLRAANQDACQPLRVVVVTDGGASPNSWSPRPPWDTRPGDGDEGGPELFRNLSELRTLWDAHVYVIGFFVGGLVNQMACAAAGACDGLSSCTDPCGREPANEWDTCRDPSDPATSCWYPADDAESLAAAIMRVVEGTRATELSAGTPAVVHAFDRSGTVSQAQVRAATEWPSGRGHVRRSPCTDPDPEDPGSLAPWCASAPDNEPALGLCPTSTSWDAGECLRRTAWSDRRIFVRGSNDLPASIVNPDGSASAEFVTALEDQGLITGPAEDRDAAATAIARFALGEGAEGDWKLPGLGNSAPVVLRRLPRPNLSATPSVPLRDPHCAGRQRHGADVPRSLRSQALDAWNPASWVAAPEPHDPVQEAVLVGDDYGILHAFALQSGNELWGYIPDPMLPALAARARVGGALTVTAPPGLNAVINQGWVHDAGVDRWRRLAVLGFGAGARAYEVLDLSYLSPWSPEGPFRVLWSTLDAAHAPFYDAHLGESWARPALTYRGPALERSSAPHAMLVFTSGYRPAEDTVMDWDGSRRGRTVIAADVLTGAPIDYAFTWGIPTSVQIDTTAHGLVGDPAITSHCPSGFWAEAQRAYFADPAGRVYRWDLSDEGSGFSHDADSARTWGRRAGVAAELGACLGAGDTCLVSGTREPLLLPLAATAIDRIDETARNEGDRPNNPNTYLLALASGAVDDATLDRTDSSDDFHASLHVVLDTHELDGHSTFEIPPGGALTAPGDHPGYMRVAVTALQRKRVFRAFPGGPTHVEQARFRVGTQPVRGPRIFVRSLVDSQGDPIAGSEAFDITFTLHEPPSGTCDPRFYDSARGVWHSDLGATFEVVFRWIATDSAAPDLRPATDTTPGDPIGRGLHLVEVRQLSGQDCADGVCAPQVGVGTRQPCHPDLSTGIRALAHSIPLHQSQSLGFTPAPG